MTKTVLMDFVAKEDIQAFSAYLMGKSSGAGISETPDKTKAGLARDSEGRAIAQYDERLLARALPGKSITDKPAVEIMDITPERVHDKVVALFEKAYTVWHNTLKAALAPEIMEKVKQLLDPPKGGAPRVTLDSVTRAEIEILSLKDVMPHVLPEGVELNNFVRNENLIRVFYKFSESGVEVPLMAAWNTPETGTVMQSGDGVSAAPVGFFLELLDAAKKYNQTICGPRKIKEALMDMTEDQDDPEVMAAFVNYLETGSESKIAKVNDHVQVYLSPKSKSITTYLDNKIIGQVKPLDDKEIWVRPGYGWSSRAELVNRSFVAAGRQMLAEKVIDNGPGPEWEEKLEADLG